jgi:hypothetical protein
MKVTLKPLAQIVKMRKGFAFGVRAKDNGWF